MNNKLVSTLTAKGLNCNKKGFYGTLEGYQVSGNISVWLGTHVEFAVRLDETAMAHLNEMLRNQKRRFGISSFYVRKYAIGCSFAAISTKKTLEFMDSFVIELKALNVPTGCPFCGEEVSRENGISVGSGAARFLAHEKCFNEYIEQAQAEEAARKAEPVKIPQGLAGAVLGTLAGCVLWALLYMIGFMAVIAAIVTSLAAAFLWDKFGGKNCKTKIVVIWVVTIVLTIATMFLMYYIDVVQALAELAEEGLEVGISSFDVFKLLMEESEEYRVAVITDTVVSLLFVVLGNVYVTTRIVASQKNESALLHKIDN